MRFGRRACALFIIGGLLAWACRRGPEPPDPASLRDLDPAVQALIDEMTTSVNEDRSSAGRWGQLAMAYEANGFLVQASQAYEVAVALDDREPRSRYRLALLRARRGDTEAAMSDLDRVISLAPSYAPAHWRQGLWLLDRGDAAKAEAAFRAAVKAAPQDPGGQIGLALVHLSRREEAEAAAVLEKLLETVPGERYALQLLGTAYQRLGREDEARFALTVGASGQPVWADPWSDEVGQYRRGFAAMLKEATQLGLERRYDQAITLLKQLCDLRPQDTALRVYLGGMYASAGRLNDAAATLEPILAADPSQFDATMHLASGYLFAGNLDKAAAFAARALELRPSSPAAAKLHGVVHWRQGRLDEAKTYFTAAAEADPRDPMPHLWMGMILGQETRYLDARRRFETALSKNPLLGDALIGLADTYAATGAFAQAQTILKRAEQAEPDNPRLEAARTRIDTAAKAAR
jgi:tetratricopeptide (TPR) repeat protein